MRAGQGRFLSVPGTASQRALLQKRVRSPRLGDWGVEVCIALQASRSIPKQFWTTS